MTSLLACLLFAPVSASEDNGFGSAMDLGLNLLQLRATSVASVTSNHTRVSHRNPADAERELCPHEIEAQVAAQGNARFGCSGALRAQSTVQCSFWGEPHVTSLFPNGEIRGWDVLYKSGHFRLAAARDGSWEIQLFNCGVFASAVAARFGKTIFESYIDSNKQIKYLVNGNPVNNLNLRIEAASDAVTTTDTDSYSICNVRGNGQGRAGWKWSNWPVQMIPSEMSLFTIGDKMCAGCNAIMWEAGNAFHHANSGPAARNHCNAQQERDAGDVVAEAVCRDKDITMNDANNACSHLNENEQFFKDCKIDYCASGGQIVAAQEAENEEALENPQPVCVSGAGCDAANDCCNALKDESTLTLDNVVTNEICNGGEVRYASALTQNGQA